MRTHLCLKHTTLLAAAARRSGRGNCSCTRESGSHLHLMTVRCPRKSLVSCIVPDQISSPSIIQFVRQRQRVLKGLNHCALPLHRIDHCESRFSCAFCSNLVGLARFFSRYCRGVLRLFHVVFSITLVGRFFGQPPESIRFFECSFCCLAGLLFFAIFFAIFLRPTEQICPDSAGTFHSFDPVGFAIFAILGPVSEHTGTRAASNGRSGPAT